MAGPNDFLDSLPTFQQDLDRAAPAPPPPPGTPTGNGNFITSALGSGAYGALGAAAQGGEALARATGFTGAAEAARAFAERQRNTAATYARPDLEGGSWFNPEVAAYKVLQSVPGMAGVIGGAALGEAAAPVLGVGAGLGALGGAALSAFPGAVGENIQRARDEGQPVDQGAALKALALGVPEAALQSVFPAMGEGMLAGRIGGAAPKLFGSALAGKAAVGAATGAAVQVPVAAAGEALMQQMGDPNRSFAERAQGIVNAALAGGVQGAVFGGVIHSFAKKPAQAATDTDLLRVTSDPLGLPPPPTPQLPAPGTPGTEPQLQPPQRFAPEPKAPNAPPDIVVPPAQPGQAIRQLPPPVLEGQRVGSGETIPMPAPPMVGEQIEPTPPAQLEPPQRFPPTEPPASGERVVRPASDDDAVITPPPGQHVLTASERSNLADQQTADIKKATRGFLPDYLKPHLGDDVALKGAIFDEATKRDQSDQPLGSRLTAIAKKFGVLGDDGKLVDPRAVQEAQDTATAEDQVNKAESTQIADTEPQPDQANAVPARVLKDPNWSQARKDAFDKAEALRAQLPDNLSHFHTEISQLQTDLANPGKGGVARIIKRTKELGQAIEAQGVVNKVSGVEGADATARNVAANSPDETQGARKFEAEEPQGEQIKSLTPEAPSTGAAETSTPNPPTKQDQLKVKQSTARRNPAVFMSNDELQRAYANVQDDQVARRPLGAEIFARQQDGRMPKPGEGTAPVVEPTPATKPSLDMDKVKATLAKPMKALKDNLQALYDSSLPKRPAEKEGGPGVTNRNSVFKAAVEKVDAQRMAIANAVKNGDVDALSKVSDDHFSPDITDNHFEDADPKVQKLMQQHEQVVNKVLDAVKEATGKKHASADDLHASRPATPRDASIRDQIVSGKSARDVLKDIVQNGTNTARRTMAQRLLERSKANPDIRLGTMEEAAADHPNLRNIYGDYDSAGDRIRLFDSADAEHTVLHEFAHAATVRALDSDPKLSAQADSLLKRAKAQMTDEEAAHPAFKNGAEMVAEAMANPDVANFLDTLQGPQKSIWQHIKDFVGKIFGFPPGMESMLDHVEHLGGEATRVVNDSNTAAGMDRTMGLYARSAQDAGNTILRDLDRKIDTKGIEPGVYKKVLYWRTLNDIARGMARHLPSLVQKVKDNETMHNYEESWNGLVAHGNNLERKLDYKQTQVLNKLRAATYEGIDPRRTPDQHTWLGGRQAALTPKIRQANELWNQAKRGDGAIQKAYESQNNSNRAQNFASMVALGQNSIRRSGAKIVDSDAMGRFQADTKGIKSDPRLAEEFWREDVNGLLDTARKYVATAEDKAKTELDPEKKAQAQAHLENLKDLRSWISDTSRKLTAASQEPNFPLRRKGDQFVSAKILNLTEGHIAKFQDMLAKAGFRDVVLSHNVDNNQVYIRTNGETSADALRKVFQEAAKSEHGIIDPQSIKAGPAKDIHTYSGVLPLHIRNQMKQFDQFLKPPEDLEGDTLRAFQSAKEQALDNMHQQLLDLLPESSISKIFAERQGVQGASGDMGAAQLERGANTSRALAHLFTMDQMTQTGKALRDQVRAAKANPDLSIGEINKIQSAASEAMLRDAQRSWRLEKSPFDSIRKLTHFFELGLSVPYALALGTQTWTLGHGELTKHFGALKSGQNLMSSSLKSLQIMKAAFGTGEGLGGFLKDLRTPGSDRWGFILNPEKMKAAGLDAQTIKDHLTLDNMGAYNTSRSQWVSDGRHHHEGLMRQLHDVSGAWTLYSEMQPRIAVGEAALKMYRERAAAGNPPRGAEWNDEYSFAKHMIEESQFSWLNDNAPRAFGKQSGIAGAASPLLAQFQGFRGKLVEKMHREFADAMGARGADYQKQARRFLMSHLAAQTVLAGTMGLPAVGLLAGAYDKLADFITGDRTHDIRASYRKWLSDTFGGATGEVLAHGVPRLGGIDLSQHLGEDRILPFTDIMTDKRKFEDAYSDWLKGMAGSSAHLGYNMVMGARDLINGDVQEGLTKFMPEMLRNLSEANLLSRYGWTDKAGFQIPGGPPTGAEVGEKALGITPSSEANYQEKKNIASGLEERQTYDNQNIQTHLAKAFNRQDPAAFASWQRASMQYMATHPGMMPPMGSFGNYLREHMQSAALAGATGTPLGVNPRDLTTRGMVSFGNISDK